MLPPTFPLPQSQSPYDEDDAEHPSNRYPHFPQSEGQAALITPLPALKSPLGTPRSTEGGTNVYEHRNYRYEEEGEPMLKDTMATLDPLPVLFDSEAMRGQKSALPIPNNHAKPEPPIPNSYAFGGDSSTYPTLDVECAPTETHTVGEGDDLWSVLGFFENLDEISFSGSISLDDEGTQSFLSTIDFSSSTNHIEDSEIFTALLTRDESPSVKKRTKEKQTISKGGEITLQKYYVERITLFDVLLGRGERSNRHNGNLLFLKEKERFQPRYLQAQTRKEKASIAQELVDTVSRVYGARFLGQDKSNMQWYIVDNQRALEKAKQALRETKRLWSPKCGNKSGTPL